MALNTYKYVLIEGVGLLAYKNVCPFYNARCRIV